MGTPGIGFVHDSPYRYFNEASMILLCFIKEETNQPLKPIPARRKRLCCVAIDVWMVVVLAFCSGTILSFDQPTRSSLVPILVSKEDLMNAIALQSIVFNGSSVI
ncbi:MAG: hypothetical protein ACXVDN_03000, partial [Ktedonobacteraceae bacterium]